MQYVWSGIILAVAVALWLAFLPQARDLAGLSGPEPAAATSAGGTGLPVPVVAAPPQLRPLTDEVAAIGTVRGIRSAVLTSEIVGRLAEVVARPGLAVEAGALVVRLDDATAAIALERAALALADARTKRDRLARLRGSGAVTDNELTEAETATASAELAVREAELALSRHRIIAPFAGTIGLIAPQAGDYLTPGTQIAVIEDLTGLIVDFRVPDAQASGLSAGAGVMVEPVAGSAFALSASVSAVDNRADADSRTVAAEARIDSPAGQLRPGMAVRVAMDLRGPDHPAVPPEAIQWDARGAFVWVLRDGLAERLAVRIVQRRADYLLLEAQFAEGDLVVTEGMLSLRAGIAAQPVDAAAPPGPDAGADG